MRGAVTVEIPFDVHRLGAVGRHHVGLAEADETGKHEAAAIRAPAHAAGDVKGAAPGAEHQNTALERIFADDAAAQPAPQGEHSTYASKVVNSSTPRSMPSIGAT